MAYLIRIRGVSTVGVVAFALLMAACTSQKEPAAKALEEAAAALAAAEPLAARENPSRFEVMKQRLSAIEEKQRAGEYKDVLESVPILIAGIAQLRSEGLLTEVESLLKKAATSLNAVRADAERYAPEALESVNKRVEDLRGLMRAKDYDGLLSGVATLSAEIDAIKRSVEAERNLAPMRALEASGFSDPQYAGQCAAAFQTHSRTLRQSASDPMFASLRVKFETDSRLVEGFAKTLEAHAEFASRSEQFVGARTQLLEDLKPNLRPEGQNWYIQNIINRTADCAEALNPLIGDGSALEMTRMKPYLPIDEWYELVCKGGESISRLRRLEVDCGSVNAVRESIRAAQRYLIYKASPKSFSVPAGCAQAEGLVSTMAPLGWSLVLGNAAVKACTSDGIIPLAEEVLQESVRK